MHSLDGAANPALIPALDICNTKKVDSTVFLGEREEGETTFGAATGLE